MRCGYCPFDEFNPNKFYDIVVYDRRIEKPDGYDVDGIPYKVMQLEPMILRDGYVITEYGKCRFNGYSFMCIDNRAQ